MMHVSGITLNYHTVRRVARHCPRGEGWSDRFRNILIGVIRLSKRSAIFLGVFQRCFDATWWHYFICFIIFRTNVEYWTIVKLYGWSIIRMNLRPSLQFKLMLENIWLQKLWNRNSSVNQLNKVAFEQVWKDIWVLILDNILNYQGNGSYLVGFQSNVYCWLIFC